MEKVNPHWSWKDIITFYGEDTQQKNGSDAFLYDYLIAYLCEEEKNYDYSKLEDWNLASMRVEK